MATVLTEQGEMAVAATDGSVAVGRRCRTRHRLDAEAGGHVPATISACRCRVRDGRIDVAAFWRAARAAGGAAMPAGETWVLGAGAEQRNDGAGRFDGAGLHPARSGRRAAHAVGAAGEEGVPLYLGLLVRLSL